MLRVCLLTAQVYNSFSTETTAKWVSPAHTCWALLPAFSMSSFCGVNLPPPQKYTSLERVVTTATELSFTVFSLEHGSQRKESVKKNKSQSQLLMACAEIYHALIMITSD